MSVHLYRVILPVSNIDAAEQLYEAALGMKGQRVSPGRHYFDCGGTILACYDPRADGDDQDASPNFGHLYFAVDDLDAVFARCRELDFREIDGEVVKQPWGERSFYATDPFGNKLCWVDRATMFTGHEAGP